MDRHITRSKAPDGRTRRIAAEIPRLDGPCIACADCQGLCAELIEVIALPEAVLRGKTAKASGGTGGDA